MPHRIASLLASNEKLLVPYLTPEFPVAGATVPALLALQESGANLIELGMPHSDPLADGTVIQAASQVAIKNGASLSRVLELVREARAAGVGVPVVLMGYINPILAYGAEKFLAEAALSGADGLIIPDLPPEEALNFKARADHHRLSMIFLISPVSDAARIRFIDSLSTHFSYCISTNGVTGRATGGAMNENQLAFLLRVRANTQKKFVVGFGIRDAVQVKAMLETADGAVVGSALLEAIEAATSPEQTASLARAFWRNLMDSEASALINPPLPIKPNAVKFA
ncbi:MAG: tryptophan synthase subunit alpha [Rhizobacter sp.]|nr:tryptophan synthase subunit alpha [Chlorobiales bacterium]